MIQVRSFRNADLPALVDVWVRHWSALTASPPESVKIIEQAILARSFFDPASLLVAVQEESIQGWCHTFADRHDPTAAVLGVICFAPEAEETVGDELLAAAEASIAEAGFGRILAGPLRDDQGGYAGLDPLGHGIGIPEVDTRTNSLLARRGYTVERVVERMVVSTNLYRAPVNRQFLQFRRTTRVERDAIVPTQQRQASAMSHLDIERHRLIDKRAGKQPAKLDVWTSDPEFQVMNGADAILDLGPAHQRGALEPAESFLIASMIQSLADRHVFSLESAVDASKGELIAQLKELRFETIGRGFRWEKTLHDQGGSPASGAAEES